MPVLPLNRPVCCRREPAEIRARTALLIADGELSSGKRLPPVRTLARQLDVNVNTVRTAYARLEADGLVRTRHGVGTVVLLISATTPPPGVGPLGINTVAVAVAVGGIDGSEPPETSRRWQAPSIVYVDQPHSWSPIRSLSDIFLARDGRTRTDSSAEGASPTLRGRVPACASAPHEATDCQIARGRRHRRGGFRMNKGTTVMPCRDAWRSSGIA